MTPKTENFHQYFFASCPKGLEDKLEEEIRSAGVERANCKNGGVQFCSTYLQALEIILTSRIASRVFHEITFFKVRDERDIYTQALKHGWAEIFSLRQKFKINTLLDFEAKEKFKNSIFLSQLLKDAIVDQFRQSSGERPSVDTLHPDVSFLLRIEKRRDGDGFQANIFLDLAGQPLSNRGYRRGIRFVAPLRENLAAGIILNSDWNSDKELFIDSMCGSGTLLIEAALIKGKIPPSYLRLFDFLERKRRSWAFLAHSWYLKDQKIQIDFKKLANEMSTMAKSGLKNLSSHFFHGYDISPQALVTAKESIKNAHLPYNVINLKMMDAVNLKPPKNEDGIIVCNPPYGERMKEEDDGCIEKLYHDYGENLKKNFKHFRAYIFTGKPELRKNISLQTSKRTKLFNGNIECRLLRYDLF